MMWCTEKAGRVSNVKYRKNYTTWGGTKLYRCESGVAVRGDGNRGRWNREKKRGREYQEVYQKGYCRELVTDGSDLSRQSAKHESCYHLVGPVKERMECT